MQLGEEVLSVSVRAATSEHKTGWTGVNSICSYLRGLTDQTRWQSLMLTGI